jgi:hypothetical protein
MRPSEITPCGSYKNRRFGRMYRLHHQGVKNQRTDVLRSVLQLLVTDNDVPSALIISTLMMKAIRSSNRRFLQEPYGAIFQKSRYSLNAYVFVYFQTGYWNI